MKRFKKKNKHLLILIGILTLVIGYAYVSTNLDITGSLFLKSAKWDIHFENIKITPGSAPTENEATIKNKTTVEFSVGLDKPGDFYEFTVDAKNDGLIDGIIETVDFDVYDPTGETKLSNDEIPTYVSKTITYSDDTPLQKNDLLSAGKTKKYKIRVEYTDEVEEKDINKDFSCMFKASVKYRQSGKTKKATATFIANTDSNVKGLIGVAYLNPINIYESCDEESSLVDIPLYPATAGGLFGYTVDSEYNDYTSRGSGEIFPATSYATTNDSCMKWYVYKDTGTSYKMLLDHNLTATVTPVPQIDSAKCFKREIDETLEYENFTDEEKECIYYLSKELKRDTEGWHFTPSIMTLSEIEEATNLTISSSESLSNEEYYWLFDNTKINKNYRQDENTYKETFGDKAAVDDGYWLEPFYDISYSPYYNPPLMYASQYRVMCHDYNGGYCNIESTSSYETKDTYSIGVRPTITVPKTVFKSH